MKPYRIEILNDSRLPEDFRLPPKEPLFTVNRTQHDRGSCAAAWRSARDQYRHLIYFGTNPDDRLFAWHARMEMRAWAALWKSSPRAICVNCIAYGSR